MSTPLKRRIDQITADQALIDGVTKFLATYPSLTVGSQTLTTAAIVQLLQNRVDANKAAQAAEIARTAAVKANRDERAKTAGFVQALRNLVLGMYAESPDTLAVFGQKPRKVPVESAATRAAAAVKAKATRKARRPLGTTQTVDTTGSSTPAVPPKPTT
jgi:hypothetical protein